MQTNIKRKIRERTIEAELVARVKALGGLCEKVKVIGQRGWPDRLVMLPGPFIALAETKRPIGGRLSEQQKSYRKKLTALGILVVVIKNSEQIEQLVQTASRKELGPRRS
jgi:hypothetical protein